MQIKSILKRFDSAKADRPTAQGESTPANERPVVRRSELTTLFRSVLDEKQNDLPVRRARKVQSNQLQGE